MKTGKAIKMGILPLTTMLFLVIFILMPNLYGQEGKTKKEQPDVQIDVRREYDENGNVNRYDSSYSFSWSYDGSMDLDSLFESLRNNFGISPFDDDDFFEDPFHGVPFNDTLGDEFFNAPFFEQEPRYWPEFDMRSMMENHRKMMEEMHKYFEFNMPPYPLAPDSIPQNPLHQRYVAPPKPLPKGQEI